MTSLQQKVARILATNFQFAHAQTLTQISLPWFDVIIISQQRVAHILATNFQFAHTQTLTWISLPLFDVIGEQKFTCTLKNLASRFVLSMEYITRWRGFRNDSMDALLSRHLPIITNRLKFFPTNIGPPPVITSTIDFAN